MKSLRTILPLKRSAIDISSDSCLAFIGSCFSDHIYNLLRDRRFHVISNPFGILYNPISISSSIINIFNKKEIEAADVFQSGELWTSWNTHRSLSSSDKKNYISNYNQRVDHFHTRLTRADVLFVTLGSAYAYYYKEGDILVANCQKYPGEHFNKKLLSIQEITSSLAQMVDNAHAYNADLQIVFTVSPVRHIRDGIIENNLSKAHLLASIHALTQDLSHVSYFPSYELMIDDLRDYRFYKTDRLHPTEEAVSYIWDYFKGAYFTEDTLNMIAEIDKLNNAMDHIPLFPDTHSHRNFLANTAKLEARIRNKYPLLNWE